MSYRTPKVGDVVYPSFTPVQAGRVTSVTGPGAFGFFTVTFVTLSGKEITTQHFRYYEDLVEDHRRKYERHKAVLDMLLEGSG